ncbi:FHIPEP family type III secretion protein, partial [Pseudomonas aeruginosa]|uniref:FHIPEP family type III secretion protein n=1 Tax=Pseudomonas aeruginosa TaxID=287 RepID=UPI00301E2F3F
KEFVSEVVFLRPLGLRLKIDCPCSAAIMLSRSDLLTLLTINFIVVTKGAERISEVSARFTLDAMPGKQMAIDADLNAGLINQAQAQKSE